MFTLEVKDVYNFGNVSIIVGKANQPLFDVKVECDNKTLSIKPVWGNTSDKKELSFQVWNGKADKSLIGKTFKGVA